jgi:hypothetical protein
LAARHGGCHIMISRPVAVQHVKMKPFVVVFCKQLNRRKKFKFGILNA